ncbi:MAG: hypothetical protein AB1668_02575 [Nanoarchaeota archaeon]
MEPENTLLENVNEFVKNAKKAKEDASYNSATTLFFKALAVATDLFILKKKGLFRAIILKDSEFLKRNILNFTG